MEHIIKLKGIVPGHRVHLIPDCKGILIAFNKTEIDLSNASVYPKNLYQIKDCKSMRDEANLLMPKNEKKRWSFCYIINEDGNLDEQQLAMAMNVAFLPEIRSCDHKNDKNEFGHDERINAIFNKVIDIDKWELGCELPELSKELGKGIWIP